MKRRLLCIAIVAFTLGMLPGAVAAQDEALSPKALEIANNLNCPVCEGQSVRDSNSQLARDMRQTIQEMLDEGYTEEEIYDYFADPDRYGPGILREPPKSGFFMTLWWAPVIGLAVGILVLGTFVTQRRRSAPASGRTQKNREQAAPTTTEDDDLREYEERVLRDLDDSSGSREKA